MATRKDTAGSAFQQSLKETTKYFTYPNDIYSTTSNTRVQYGTSHTVSEGIKTFVSTVVPIHLKRGPTDMDAEKNTNMQPAVKFPTEEITRIAKYVLETRLEGKIYEEEECKTFSKELCSEIQHEIRKLDLPRYKFVCYVHIGQICSQGMRTASRCLWDATVDNYAAAKFENETLCATASIFGFYHE